MALHCERCGQANAANARFCRHCGSPLGSLADPVLPSIDALIGQHVLGRYEITALIGEGGMGRVYSADQRVGTTTRKVAVKTLRAELGADPQLVKRFYREAETIVRLTHPNTIQFFDFGELADRTLVIVMEFIEGGSLADALLKGPLGLARFDRILTQICGALLEAHLLGIVHRDLKPDNILLTERGGQTDFVKVLDFGIAKISSRGDDRPESTRLTQQGMMVGTPPYMSPEQFSGELVDPRSDIYSLGVIAYEMLTGHLPFNAKTPWEWASKHLTAEPAPLRVDVQSGISERRAWAIRRALSKAASDRQPDVQEFLNELTGTTSWGVAAQYGPRPSGLPATPAAPTPIHTRRSEPELDTSPDHRPQRRAGLPVQMLLMGAVLALGAVGAWYAARARHPAPAVADLPPVTRSVARPASPGASVPVSRQIADEVAAQGPGLGSAARHQAADGGVPVTPTAAVHALPKRASRRHSRNREETDVRPTEPQGADGRSVTSESGPATEAGAAPAPMVSQDPVQPAAIQPASAPAPKKSIESIETPKDLAERVKRGLTVVDDRPEVAVGMYQAAVAKYGAGQAALGPLRQRLGTTGSQRVRELVGAGRCAQAQALFRALRSAGVAAAAGRAFGRSCVAPP